MNALVASIIRTLVPHIVTQVASLFLMINIHVPADILLQLSTLGGVVLFALYYGGVRVLEQQWPGLGILLGLPSSPDTYSKGDPASVPAPAVDNSDFLKALQNISVAPASIDIHAATETVFPAAAVAAAQAAVEPAPLDVHVDLPDASPAPAAPEVPVPTV